MGEAIHSVRAVSCPGCCLPHDPEPCRREAADCDCCRAIELCEWCEVTDEEQP